MNLVNHIGNKVTVWTVDGNGMENRTLLTADELGIVVSPRDGAKDKDSKVVFVPWNRVKYVDLLKSTETSNAVKSQDTSEATKQNLAAQDLIKKFSRCRFVRTYSIQHQENERMLSDGSKIKTKDIFGYVPRTVPVIKD